MEKYQENDVILCKVKNIVKPSVFVETLDGIKGSIVFSEVAPGRIRNLREYVVPNKIIVCKVLRIKDNHLFLSLRRVNTDERRTLMNQYKKEKTFQSILKKICGEDCAKDIINKIQKEESLVEFFEKAKDKKSILKEYFNKEQIEQIEKVLETKKEKDKSLKKEFKFSSSAPNGIGIIKKILGNSKNITYLGNSKFQIKITSKDLKKANQEINETLKEIEKLAKKNKCIFELKK
jgi:translation initiation factor 2 alpha subunit (eIF-2alpha)